MLTLRDQLIYVNFLTLHLVQQEWTKKKKEARNIWSYYVLLSQAWQRAKEKCVTFACESCFGEMGESSMPLLSILFRNLSAELSISDNCCSDSGKHIKYIFHWVGLYLFEWTCHTYSIISLPSSTHFKLLEDMHPVVYAGHMFYTYHRHTYMNVYFNYECCKAATSCVTLHSCLVLLHF
jgi:hypothetical protein